MGLLLGEVRWTLSAQEAATLDLAESLLEPELFEPELLEPELDAFEPEPLDPEPLEPDFDESAELDEVSDFEPESVPVEPESLLLLLLVLSE
ncbi:MAG: hypothetical protein ABIR12_05925 [Ilumatobacteraceae bacterium]